MSHASGYIVKDGKKIGHFEYNGTADIAISAIWDTEQEMSDHWRSGQWNYCTCGQPPVEVIAYTSYGSGFHWDATVCLTCRTFESGWDPWEKGRPNKGEPVLVVRM